VHMGLEDLSNRKVEQINWAKDIKTDRVKL
jgi:hypothetical protein